MTRPILLKTNCIDNYIEGERAGGKEGMGGRDYFSLFLAMIIEREK